MRHALAILVALGLLACGGPRQGPTTGPGPDPDGGSGAAATLPGGEVTPGTPATPEQITVDTPRETPGGVAYTIPAGWSVLANGAMVIMTPQEPESHVAIIDATATEPDAAVAEAWKLYRTAPTPKLQLAVDVPAQDGWDQIRQYAYDLPPNEKRVAVAAAFRKGTAWSVVIFDFAQGTAEKRGAQVALVGGSLRPKGHDRESFAGKTANKLDAARLAKVDAFIELGRKELGIPGISIAIVQDGKVIHARGYGVRQLGKKPAVGPATLYPIASNTKALTTLLLAELVDDGKLTWNQHVTEVYPDFKLGDAATTASVEVRHLICACTGLPRQDLEWIFEYAKTSPLGAMKLLATIQPTTKFGETFQYSNLLAAAAGFVAAHVANPKLELGKAYDAAMKARVFAPLGMKATTFDFARALKAEHASPHAMNVDGQTVTVAMDPNYSVVPFRPAGGAWSSVNDLIKYVQMELADGVGPGGKRIVSKENLLARRAAQVKIGEHATYGMGLFVDTKYGIPVVNHGGALFGYKSDMMWLPEHAVGAVILTNSDLGQAMLGAFDRYLLELLFDGKPEAEEEIRFQAKLTREATAKQREQLAIPPDPAQVAALATRYRSDALGALTVVPGKAGEVIFDFGEWKSPVATRQNADGTVSFVLTTPVMAGFELVVAKAADGTRQLVARDAQHEYTFAEIAAN